jgi:FHS family L-fucose permease-like MFS transporter
MDAIRMLFLQTAKKSLFILSFVFFIWGFVTWMNYHFIPVLQFILELNKTQEWFMQVVFFCGYFLMAIPAALFLKRVGYKMSFIIGLITIGLGSVMFCGAATYISYSLFLIGFFVMATGITLLQVAGNTYVVLLGSPDRSVAYLCLIQGINSLGVSLIPFIASFLYPYGEFDSVILNANYLITPYFVIALFCVLLAAVFVFSRFAVVPVSAHFNIRKAFKDLQVKIASIAIFMYVGAEFFISLCISYLCTSVSSSISASQVLLLYWALAMVGRFAGWYWNKQYSLANVLQQLSLIAIFIVLLVPFVSTTVAIFMLASLGICHSVMFPFIFADTLKRSKTDSLAVSSIMVMVISGGGFVPLVAFYLSKWIDIQYVISTLAICYASVWYYAYFIKRKLK